MEKITAKQFEQKVLDLEEIVLVIRAPSDAQVDNYDYERKATGSITLSKWIDSRLKSKIGDMEFQIIGGEYTQPHGLTKLATLRKGYER